MIKFSSDFGFRKSDQQIHTKYSILVVISLISRRKISLTANTDAYAEVHMSSLQYLSQAPIPKSDNKRK